MTSEEFLAALREQEEKFVEQELQRILEEEKRKEQWRGV